MYHPRAAATKAFAHAIGLEHSRSYFDAFDKLSKRVLPRSERRTGRPRAASPRQGGAGVPRGDVLKTLREDPRARRDAVDASRPVLARALGLVDGADESSPVNAAALAAVFPVGTDERSARSCGARSTGAND